MLWVKIPANCISFHVFYYHFEMLTFMKQHLIFEIGVGYDLLSMYFVELLKDRAILLILSFRQLVSSCLHGFSHLFSKKTDNSKIK
jgi:hypothetical protein